MSKQKDEKPLVTLFATSIGPFASRKPVQLNLQFPRTRHYV
jgi:hypothetical protein